MDDLHTVWSNSTSVRAVSVNGPLNASGPGDTPSRQAIFSCIPASVSAEEPCARQILENLAYKAYRRPVSERAMDTLLAFYRDGRELRDFDTGIQYALARILVDPMFVFRFESEPEGINVGQNYQLQPYELASRLSFFIWSSIPDEELLASAKSGALADSKVQEQQIQRMLSDPKADSLVKNFAASWLSLRQLNSVNPTAQDFDGSLQVAMRRETELLLETVILEDRPVIELLTADYSFVNERLARHYGIPNIRGSHFRKVNFGGNRTTWVVGAQQHTHYHFGTKSHFTGNSRSLDNGESAGNATTAHHHREWKPILKKLPRQETPRLPCASVWNNTALIPPVRPVTT